MAGMYDQAILDELKCADRPLRHRDLVDRIAPDNWNAFVYIGTTLTKLFRAGMIARSRPGNWYEYTYVEKPRIQAGYTWRDASGPMVVMAVADGYAMCRSPGALPFIRTVCEIESERDRGGCK